LPYFLLAALPALAVGLLVYVFAGGGGGSGGAGVIDGFIRLSPSEGSNTTSYEGRLPPGFPDQFPRYGGSDVVVSFAIESADGTSYFAVLSSKDSADDVYNYYLKALDEDPWQVEIARSSTDFMGMRFVRPDNADIEGDVTLNHSDLDDSTSIFVTIQDLAATGGQSGSQPFVLTPSRALPPGFPNDVPIYDGRDDSVVVDTYVQRGGGGTNYLVTFLTKDSQRDILSFYRQEFQRRGWTVTDSDTTENSFATGIDFSDGPQNQLTGTITIDSYEEDSSYNRVDVFLSVTGSRGRGN
jgi:hypothetical protein